MTEKKIKKDTTGSPLEAHVAVSYTHLYHQIVSIFIKQLYEVLVGDAKKKKDGSLDIPVHMVMDEFCNIPRIGNMSNMITAAASRNIFLSLVVQSYHQLEGLYGADADTIKGNCQNLSLIHI